MLQSPKPKAKPLTLPYRCWSKTCAACAHQGRDGHVSRAPGPLCSASPPNGARTRQVASLRLTLTTARHHCTTPAIARAAHCAAPPRRPLAALKRLMGELPSVMSIDWMPSPCSSLAC
eukprot:4373107-Prymnesium_polylepis.1